MLELADEQQARMPSVGEAAADVGVPVSIWRNRAFLLLFSSYSLSLLGNTFHSIALNLWVLQTTGSAKLMSLVLIAHLVVGMVFGAFAGTVADRTDRRRLMWMTDLSRFVMVGLIALTMAWANAPFLPIIILTALVAFAGTFRTPAFQASLIEIVGKDRVAQAVGAISLSDNLVRIGGYALGGIAVALLGGVAAIAIDAAAFLVSALLLLAAGKFPYAADRSTERSQSSFKEDLLHGFRFIRQDPFTKGATVLLPLVLFFFLSTFMLIQVMAVKVWKATPVAFGLLEACIPLGYIIGSLLIMRFDKRFRQRGKWILISMIAIGPIFVAIALTESTALALPLVLLVGLLFSFSTTMVYVVLRVNVDPSIQGRVFGMLGALTSVAPPLGLALFSALSDLYGPAPIIAGSGCAMLAAGAAAYFKLTAVRNFQ